MVDQEKVLGNLLEFYKKKSPSLFKLKFINSVMNLVREGDIEESVFMKFCDDNDIESSKEGSKLPPIEKIKRKVKDTEVKPFRDYSRSWCDSDPQPPKTFPKDIDRYGSSSC